MEVGEISKAAELANPIWRVANMSPGDLEAHATDLFEVPQGHARDEMMPDVEVYNLAESLLQEAINNGEPATIEEGETFEGKHDSKVASGFKYTTPPDLCNIHISCITGQGHYATNQELRTHACMTGHQ